MSHRRDKSPPTRRHRFSFSKTFCKQKVINKQKVESVYRPSQPAPNNELEQVEQVDQVEQLEIQLLSALFYELRCNFDMYLPHNIIWHPKEPNLYILPDGTQCEMKLLRKK